ncbi:MAG TPA: acyl-CoA dehydrogenase family protein [Actinophytocola sp.]|jgi:alkylation response protein AidB-like acyl-CoA dehydrogenase|nr:acyl-CoA dehydrogenase family protein [Actinophytocola sp.]
MTIETAATLLDAVRELAPTITKRAAEIEAARRLPPDLVESLTDAGCFRMLLPRSHGGMGLELPAAMRVLEALSRVEGSVGWTVMIGAGSWCDLAGLPRASFDAIYAGGPVITGGAISPSGTATAVDGGYRIRGRWAFASGCQHSAWLAANCVEDVDDEPRLRLAVLSAAEVEIEDTWRAAGLCGTGSHHFAVHDVVIPAERTYALLEGEPCVDEAVVRIPVPALIALIIGSVAVGIAQGALDDIHATAVTRTPLFAAGSLAGNPLFQHQLATADTRLRAARALLNEEAASTWATAAAREELTLEERARIRAAGVWVTSTAATVVDFCYRAGGGGAVYLDNPLQRRLRDINTVTQHFLVRPDTLTTAGAILAGQDLELPIF